MSAVMLAKLSTLVENNYSIYNPPLILATSFENIALTSKSQIPALNVIMGAVDIVTT